MLDLRLNIDNLLFIIMNPAKNISGANGYAESKFQARACKKCVAYNVYVTYYKLNLWNIPDDTHGLEIKL